MSLPKRSSSQIVAESLPLNYATTRKSRLPELDFADQEFLALHLNKEFGTKLKANDFTEVEIMGEVIGLVQNQFTEPTQAHSHQPNVEFDG
jgi:hypothetical protein